MPRPRKRRIAEDGEETPRIARRLAEMRRQRGLTQVDVAKKLRVSQSVVSDWERGRKRLHGQLILQLSRVLGVSTDELLGAPNARVAQSRTEGLAPFLRRLRHVHRLSPSERKALLVTIDAFLAKAS